MTLRHLPHRIEEPELGAVLDDIYWDLQELGALVGEDSSHSNLDLKGFLKVTEDVDNDADQTDDWTVNSSATAHTLAAYDLTLSAGTLTAEQVTSTDDMNVADLLTTKDLTATGSILNTDSVRIGNTTKYIEWYDDSSWTVNLYASAANVLKTDDEFQCNSLVVNDLVRIESDGDLAFYDTSLVDWTNKMGATNSEGIFAETKNFFVRSPTNPTTHYLQFAIGETYRGINFSSSANDAYFRWDAVDDYFYTNAPFQTTGLITISDVNPALLVTDRFRINNTAGYLEWYSGSQWDVNLYRFQADTLKTDDSFVVGGDLTVSGGDITGAQNTKLDIGEANANYLRVEGSGRTGIVIHDGTQGPVFATYLTGAFSPNALELARGADYDVYCFANAGDGENPEFRIYGFDTTPGVDAVKYGSFAVANDGTLTITAEDGAISLGDDNLATTGSISGATITDGTLSVTSGAVTGATNITASGRIAGSVMCIPFGQTVNDRTTSVYLRCAYVIGTSNRGIPMSRAGSITGLAWYMNVDDATNSCTIATKINDVDKLTDTHDTGTGHTTGTATAARGTHAFSAGDMIQVQFQVTGTFQFDQPTALVEVTFDG